MEGDDSPASALYCAGEIEILFVSGKAVEENDRRMRAGASGQIELRVDARSLTQELKASAAGGMSGIDWRVRSNRRR